MGLLDGIKRFFGVTPDTDAPTSDAPSAKDVLREMKSEKRGGDAEWTHLTNRFATLVLSESDRQRLWKRAHRGADASARLLSGITSPTPEEKRILDGLVKEHETGR